MSVKNKETGDLMYETRDERRTRKVGQGKKGEKGFGKEKMLGIPRVVKSKLNTKEILEQRIQTAMKKFMAQNMPAEYESFEDAMDFDTGEDRELKSPYEINDEEMAYTHY